MRRSNTTMSSLRLEPLLHQLAKTFSSAWSTRVPRTAEDKQVSRVAFQIMRRALLTTKFLTTSTRQLAELRKDRMRFGDKQVLDDVSLVVDPQESFRDWNRESNGPFGAHHLNEHAGRTGEFDRRTSAVIRGESRRAAGVLTRAAIRLGKRL